jgi:hypothetical protein
VRVHKRGRIVAKKNHNDEIETNDLPQEITESYGTGVKNLPGYNIGGRTMRQRAPQYTHTSPKITGGDIDAN